MRNTASTAANIVHTRLYNTTPLLMLHTIVVATAVAVAAAAVVINFLQKLFYGWPDGKTQQQQHPGLRRGLSSRLPSSHGGERGLA